MKEREKLKEESHKKYMRNKALVDDIIEKLKKEDMDLMEDLNRKKEIAKSYMEQAYKEKEQRKKQKIEVI